MFNVFSVISEKTCTLLYIVHNSFLFQSIGCFLYKMSQNVDQSFQEPKMMPSYDLSVHNPARLQCVSVLYCCNINIFWHSIFLEYLWFQMLVKKKEQHEDVSLSSSNIYIYNTLTFYAFCKHTSLLEKKKKKRHDVKWIYFHSAESYQSSLAGAVWMRPWKCRDLQTWWWQWSLPCHL